MYNKQTVKTKIQNNLGLNLNKKEIQFLSELRDIGFDTYIVGEALRDLVLDRESSDLDVFLSSSQSSQKQLESLLSRYNFTNTTLSAHTYEAKDLTTYRVYFTELFVYYYYNYINICIVDLDTLKEIINSFDASISKIGVEVSAAKDGSNISILDYKISGDFINAINNKEIEIYRDTESSYVAKLKSYFIPLGYRFYHKYVTWL